MVWNYEISHVKSYPFLVPGKNGYSNFVVREHGYFTDKVIMSSCNQLRGQTELR